MQLRNAARRLSTVAGELAATKTTTIAAPSTTTAPPPPPSPTGKIDPIGGNLFSLTVYAPPPPTAIPGDN